MTAAILTASDHLWEVCSAYFQVHGHTVRRIASGETVGADVVIVDHPYGLPLRAFDCNLLVVLSAGAVECPPGSWFFLKPVDLDVMMSRVIEQMREGAAP